MRQRIKSSGKLLFAGILVFRLVLAMVFFSGGRMHAVLKLV
jgi:hypothetical protein